MGGVRLCIGEIARLVPKAEWKSKREWIEATANAQPTSPA